MTRQSYQLAQKKLVSTFVTIVGLFVLVVSFQNCSGEHSKFNSGSTAPSQGQQLAEFEFQASLVLEQNCASCHSPGSDVESNLEDIMDFQALYADGLIVQGEPENSPLYLAVLDGIMPHEGDMLEPGDIEILRDWIVALADPFATGGIIPSPGDVPSDEQSITFAYVNNVISRNCAGCHNPSDPARSNLDTYEGIVGQVNVDNPRSSPLYQEILNNNMPPGGGLSGQARFILQWIEGGALNN